MASKRVKRKKIKFGCRSQLKSPGHEHMSFKVHMERKLFFAFFFFCSLVWLIMKWQEKFVVNKPKSVFFFFGVQRDLGSISAAFGDLSAASFSRHCWKSGLVVAVVINLIFPAIVIGSAFQQNIFPKIRLYSALYFRRH